jgi:hypothetical protein
VRTVAAQRRLPQVPGWLIEAARLASGPVPWAAMGLAALAIGVPLAAGLAAGQRSPGCWPRWAELSVRWLTGPVPT